MTTPPRSADRAEARSAAVIVAGMPEAVLVTGTDGRIERVNPAAEDMLGRDAAELTGMPIDGFVEYPHNPGEERTELAAGSEVQSRAMIWRAADGHRVEVSVSVLPLPREGGAAPSIAYVAFDLSARKRARQIQYQAFHDALTGLFNRQAFVFHLDDTLRSGGDAPAAVVLMDLDGFKHLNDSLGHHEGDDLLRAVARRLREALGERDPNGELGGLGENDRLARLGGDEFAVLLANTSPAAAEKFAAKLVAALAQPYRLSGDEIFLTTSAGIALAPAHGEDAESLLANAEAAMYTAKHCGGNRVQVSGPAVVRSARDKLDLQWGLRRALERGELALHYQPVARASDGAIVSFEALLRWRHPRRGWVRPDLFIHLAEADGSIVPIGEWALATACAQLRDWRAAGSPDLRIAVNVSARQFQGSDLVPTVARVLAETGLPAAALQIEITESGAMANVDHTVAMLQALRLLGVKVAVDDFGTGYSSLSYLQRFPLDTLKIDQSFVRALGGDNNGELVAAILAMARALGLEVVAEGVETRAQLDFLRAQGCQYVQGYWISEPLPAGRCAAALDGPAQHRAPGDRIHS